MPGRVVDRPVIDYGGYAHDQVGAAIPSICMVRPCSATITNTRQKIHGGE